MTKTDGKDKAGGLQIVSFTIDDKEYAIEISKIIEIIYYKAATALPQSPQFIEGVVDLRGTVIPVLDLKKRLRLVSKTAGSSNHILIVRFGDKMVGIVVDDVKEVLQIEEGQIQSPQTYIKGGGSKHLRGVCKVHDQLIFILSLDTLLSDDEQAQLREI
ncbi:MAG: purine-binding chemotaxis protein CheW [Nitrospirae bacterium]|nr:purine-binding chemotaxis protein CheW [Nitrospirota bacterium]